MTPRLQRQVLWSAFGLLLLAACAAGLAHNARLFTLTLLNGLTLAALYFLVASGFTLVFGLMRIVNLAHGSLFLLGAYVGYSVGQASGSWVVALMAGTCAAALAGLAMQLLLFRHMEGEDMRQTLVSIGLSIVLADVMLWVWGGDVYQFDAPEWMVGRMPMPIVSAYPTFRVLVLVAAVAIGLLLWALLNRTRVGLMIRAGVDDRQMLSASGVNVHLVFAATFAIGAGLAGLGGVIGGTVLSISPGEDVRYLLASLVVVIVGGIGSIYGAALGALLIGLAETFGLAYAPTYGVVFTFALLVLALAFRPEGIVGSRR
jgi:branched-chain amino acid transport system permease protein